MSLKTIGSKYLETRGQDIAQIAKLVRADIAAEVKAGLLPKIRYSVRIDRYSMGQSLDVTAMGLVGREVLKRIEAIVAAYNRDESDPQTDYFNVRFYSNVQSKE